MPYLRGYGGTRFLSADAVRNGQQSIVAVDIIAFMDALQVKKAIPGGFDWAPVPPTSSPPCGRTLPGDGLGQWLSHRQPVRQSGPLSPRAELAWWYQFYFATDRGAACYAANTRDFARLIWQLASPQWRFDDATFARSAAAIDNPDHVAVVIDNYRWRLGLSSGERQYDALEEKLAAASVIAVPVITMEGDANGAPHPAPAVCAGKFTGKYQHREITGGIGHNLPQEAPLAFAQAILDVVRL